MRASLSKRDRERLLTYITGLLYFHGARDVDGLVTAVNGELPLTVDRENLAKMLQEEMERKGASCGFSFDDGYFAHVNLADLPWLVSEQEQRDYLPFRPVSEEEARQVAEEEFTSLWEEPVKKAYLELKSAYGLSSATARAEIMELDIKSKNDRPLMEAVSGLIGRLEFRSQDEANQFLQVVMEMVNNLPRWVLKGWTPAYVFENYEKKALKPLPATDFNPDEESSGLSAARRRSGTLAGRETRRASGVGRNQPCPCGSGKKSKKCCGAPQQGRDTAGASEGSPTGLVKQIVSASPEKQGNTGGVGEKTETREPTREEWSALYQAAAEFRDDQPWSWMDDVDLFGVKDPETGETAYCCILGAEGSVFGLVAYRGAEGLKVYSQTVLGEVDTSSPDLASRLYCLMATFENREDVYETDRAVIKQLGLRFRGQNKWPVFRSCEPGLYPWYLDGGQCRFLTAVLQQAREVALRCRRDKSWLQDTSTRHPLVRVPLPRPEPGTRGRAGDESGEASPAGWEDQYPDLPPDNESYVSVAITDEVRLKKLESRRESGDFEGLGTVEADTFYTGHPVQEKKDERPYYPVFFALVDASEGRVVGHEMVRSLEQEGERCLEALLRLLEAGRMPSRIAVEREETYFLLEASCRQLQITLELVEELECMPELRNHIAAME